jgi:hypothetical protein
MAGSPPSNQIVREVRQLYQQADVFQTALKLVDKHQARAEQVADQIQPDTLRRLLYFLVDTVLERPQESAPSVVPIAIPLVSLRSSAASEATESSSN